MKYPGKELEIFDKATIFQKYIFFLIKKYLKKNIFEVGAGIGSFTRHYIKSNKKILLSDLDLSNYNFLKRKFLKFKNINVTKNKTNKIKNKFDNIIYLNVLEHIKNDKKEIKIALSKLNKGGSLIILVPAHQKLYTRFDREIGHFRRYNINFFKKNKPENARIQKLVYLDLAGYFLYFFNKFFFKKEIYPSLTKIILWDKIFVPITIILDFIFFYKLGKNILCIYKKII